EDKNMKWLTMLMVAVVSTAGAARAEDAVNVLDDSAPTQVASAESPADTADGDAPDARTVDPIVKDAATDAFEKSVEMGVEGGVHAIDGSDGSAAAKWVGPMLNAGGAMMAKDPDEAASRWTDTARETAIGVIVDRAIDAAGLAGTVAGSTV